MTTAPSHFTRHHYLNLVKELALCEFKLRDQSTLLGFLWTLLHPTLLFVVLYGLFVKWMGNHVESFPIYLMVGVVQYNYFSKTTTSGLTSVVQKSSLVTNFIFPRDILVVSTVLTNLMIHLLELAVMLPFILIFGGQFTWKWILLPFPILVETILILGISLYLARLAVDYKDIARIWEIVTMAGFFLTPIFYPMEIISSPKQKFLLLNPIARVIMETRSFLVYDRWPSAGVLFMLLLISLLLFATGYRYFKKGEPGFAEKFP